MVDPFDGFFRNSILYLKLSGCWYHEVDSPKERLFSILWAIFCFLIGSLLYLPLMLYSLTQVTDFNVAVDHVRNIIVNVASLMKLINFFLNRKTILKTLKELTSNEFNYKVYESLNPRLIVKKYHKHNERWRKSLTLSLCGVIVWYTLTPMILFFLHDKAYYIIENGENIYEQLLPYSVLNPFGQKTKTDYIKAHFFLSISIFIEAMKFCAFSVFFSCVICCVGAHLAVLAEAFKTIHPRCQDRLNIFDVDNSLLQNEMNQELIKCIKHLQTLQELFKYLNEIFYLQILTQAIAFLSTMGCNMFKLVYKGVDPMELCAWSAVLLDFFLCCWFGNMLTEGNSSLRESLYLTNWIAASKSFRGNLIITMEVLRRPVYICIAGIVPLTLETFVSMLKTSYSIFTMLQQFKMDVKYK